MQRWEGCDAKKSGIDFGATYPTFRDFMLLDGIRHCWNHHDTPQSALIDDEVDFVGRFENLQEGFDTICDNIGIRKHKLAHANKSDHKHYTDYYDEETRQMIADKYAEDIERFGYEFGS